ncbi:MAG: tyrosine-type recombinase/integrase [Methylococcaceae bacterium]|nr:tyrosine-type recombinase/integrase [Methylococcaceae bacterium]
MHELKRKDIYLWAKELTCTNKRISNLISPLRSALDDAVQNEIIETNPILGWHYKRIEPPKKSDKDPFTRDEQSLILSVLTGQAKNLIQFAFWTGLRTSELIALEWGDVDWVRGTVKVQRALTQAASEAETTKTRAGEREVKLLEPALEAIKNQKQYTFIKDNIVFLNPRTDMPWSGDQPIRKTLWTHALRKAGVRYRRPYQTRYTYAFNDVISR